MKIDPKSRIAGHPALKIRELIRYITDYIFSTEIVCDRLGISMEEAERVIAELAEAGYIEPDHMNSHSRYWKTTIKGNALALATAARPVRRSTAERKVKEFMKRVQQVNGSDYFLYRVSKVIAFGSYITRTEFINDVDLAVQLERRYENWEEQIKHEEECIRRQCSKGRRFNRFIDQALWPRREVLLFLKARSRTISLHDTNDSILKMCESRLLFPASVVKKQSSNGGST